MNNKIIKKGKDYRIHKCFKCKTIFAYKYYYNCLVYCPSCNNYLDIHIFDKKINKEKYDNIKEIK